MYTAYYNLKERPFREAADPRFTWLSKKHFEALASFKYAALEKKGFYLLTGDVGTGKTSLIKRFLTELESDTIVATVTDPDLDKLDFFNYLAEEFGLNIMFDSKGAFLTRFKKFLFDAYQKNTRVILIIDEAHRINQELLEEIRVLSNIEKAESKLINIFFVGQPEFNNILLQDPNRPLRQRISVHYHLEPLSKDETVQLILYRLKVAGAASKIFSSKAFHEIYRFSAGYPRLAVTICDRAMLSAYARATDFIDEDIIKECAEDLNIARFGREKESKAYLKKTPRASIPEAILPEASDTALKKSPIRYFVNRIIPGAQKALLPALSAVLVVVAGYLIYNFKVVFMPQTSINLAQKNSAEVQSEQSAPIVMQKNESASETNIVFEANETNNSIASEEKQTERPTDESGTDNLATDEEKIFSLQVDKLATDEDFETTTGDSDARDVRAESQSLSNISNTEATQAPQSKTNAAMTLSENTDIKPDKSPSGFSESETNTNSANKDLTSMQRSLDSDIKLTTKEQPQADTQVARLEPKTAEVKEQQPKKVASSTADVQARQKPKAAEVKRDQPKKVTESTKKVQPRKKTDTAVVEREQPKAVTTATGNSRPRQSVKKKPAPQPPASMSDSDLKPKAQQQQPETRVAPLAQVTEKSDQPDGLSLQERLQSFLRNYCRTYEAKDLDEFTTLFTPDARENEKPFYSLLPKYQRNFKALDTIKYRIELQKYIYDDEYGTVKIEGRFFLKWLPHGAEWRQNSGKIFMELEEYGKSYRVNRLDYYGERRKKTK